MPITFIFIFFSDTLSTFRIVVCKSSHLPSSLSAIVLFSHTILLSLLYHQLSISFAFLVTLSRSLTSHCLFKAPYCKSISILIILFASSPPPSSLLKAKHNSTYNALNPLFFTSTSCSFSYIIHH